MWNSLASLLGRIFRTVFSYDCAIDPGLFTLYHNDFITRMLERHLFLSVGYARYRLVAVRPIVAQSL